VRSENVTRAAEALSRQQGGNSVYSVPLRGKDNVLGVLTLEFAPPMKMPPAMADEIMIAAEVLSPTLRDRHENDRWIAVKVGHSIQNVTEMATGPKHMLVKLIIALVIAAGFFVTFYKPMYHVTCPFALEAVDKRDISAPFEGVLKKVYVVPGQHVEAGQLLAEMDTRQLEADLNQAVKKAASARAQYTACLNSRDPDQIAQAAVKLRQAEASEADADSNRLKIDRARLKADFPGIVLTGDWKPKEGSVVKQGEPLYEIAPSRHVRAVLSVPDRDIQELRDPPADVSKQQEGELATASLPGIKIPCRIQRIDPVGQPKEGETVIKVYATLDSQPAFVRPDMEGQASIKVEHRRLVWIWTHRLIDFLRLHLWL
jgi:biotin carboxyl carrier protein